MKKILANGTLVLGFVQALITLLIVFGVNITDTQTQAILGVFAALTLLLGALISPSVPLGNTTGTP